MSTENPEKEPEQRPAKKKTTRKRATGTKRVRKARPQKPSAAKPGGTRKKKAVPPPTPEEFFPPAKEVPQAPVQTNHASAESPLDTIAFAAGKTMARIARATGKLVQSAKKIRPRR